MNTLCSRFASFLAVVAALPMIGCTGLPTSPELDADHTSTSHDLCESSKEKALSCARYLRDEFAALETHIGGWETAYAITGVGLGALTAVYLKSATDRTQALEDLAVGVATLAGVHQVLKPSERIKLATQGRKAVECMIESAEAISILRKEADEETNADTGGTSKTARLRLALTKRHTSERELKSAQQEQAASSSRPLAARNQIIERVHSTQIEATSAAANVESLDSDPAPLTPMQRFEIGVEREFGLGATQHFARSTDASQEMSPAQLQTFKRGLLLLQQGRQLAGAKVKTRADAQAADDDKVVAQRLADGLHQVLSNARLAIGSLAVPADDMVTAQRDAVRKMIGDLAKSVDEEQKQSERTIGATNAVADSAETNTAANDAAAQTHSAGRVQLQQVFEQCAGGPN